MKRIIIFAFILIALITTIVIESLMFNKVSREKARYVSNTHVLLGEIGSYRTKDSLNAVQVGVLELKIKEFEKYRAEDAQTIKNLRIRNRDLQNVISSQSELILRMEAPVRDTIIYYDSKPDSLKTFEFHNPWTDLTGVIGNEIVTCTLSHRDTLLIVSSVKYKRFLGFLWKTNKIKDRQVNAVSKDPNNQILGLEFIEIER